MNHGIKKQVNNKRRMYKKFLKSKSSSDYNNYIKCRTFTKQFIRKCVTSFERKIAHESKTNVKGFWKFVNGKLKTKTSIGIINTPDGRKTNNDKEKADVLNSNFSNVFIKENVNNVPVFHSRSGDVRFG